MHRSLVRAAGLSLALLSATAAQAATSFMGNVNVDTRWTAAGSPYNLTGDVTVAPQATLTIDPGVTVNLAAADGMAGGASTAQVEFIVRGALIANGTAAQPITIKASSGTTVSWYALSFEPGALASSLTYVKISEAGTAILNRMSSALTVDHLDIDRVTTGIDWQSAGALSLADSTVTTATTGIIVRTAATVTLPRLDVQWCTGVGLDLLNGGSASTASITDSAFRSNGTGVAVRANVSATVVRSHIAFNDNGLLAAAGASLDFRNNVLVGNAVLGLDLTQNLANPISIVNNTLDRNVHYLTSTGSGIVVRAVSNASSFIIRNNNVTNHNTYGIQVIGATAPSLDHNNAWQNGTNYSGTTGGVGAISYNPLYVAPHFGWTEVTSSLTATSSTTQNGSSCFTGAGSRIYPANSEAAYVRLRGCLTGGTAPAPYTANASGGNAGGFYVSLKAKQIGVGLTCGCSGYQYATFSCSVTCSGYDYVSTSVYNYRLQPASPSIDAGNNLGAPADDMDATPRPVDGDLNSTATTDIGAYEWHSNYAPIAAAGADQTVKPATSVSLGSAGSRDPDGTIVSWDWNFGDGTAHATTSTATHTYASVGAYTVTLTVTDNLGATGSDTAVVTVANNLPPVARAGIDQFVASYAPVTLDGGGSTDADGTLVSYAWAFGDGLTGSGPLVTHTYAADGVYTATLTVTDNLGATSSDSASVVVGAGSSNVLPTARPGGPYSGAVGAAIAFNGTGSYDGDGTIAAYSWSFGDGTTGTGATPAHAYATAGTYLVTLTVIDDAGGQGKDSTLATVSTTPNQPPIARAGGNRAATKNVALAFDGSTSSDPDGTIASYLWDFGDGATATVAKPSHTWVTAGSYLVKLIVTDNGGATGTDLAIVTVNEPANQPPLARAGGDKLGTPGVAIAFDGRASTDADGTIAAWDWDFGDGLLGTGSTTSHAYTAAGTYLVSLTVTDDRGGRATDVALVTIEAPFNQVPIADAGGGHAAAVSQAIAFDGRGSSDPDGTIVAYTWDFGDGASATGAQAWHAYTAAGAYLVTLTVTDDLGAIATDQAVVSIGATGGGGVVNLPPVASAGPDRSATTGATLTFSGAGSSDADGTIAAYAWSFGDGAIAAGVSATHAYVAAGSYLVRLTVTDDKGAQDTGYALVTVTAPPPVVNAPPVARSGGGKSAAPGALVAFDGSGSADADGTVVAYAWDFGDGTADVGAAVSHRYAAAGTYLVRLTVTDDQGATASDLALVTVTAPVVAANLPPLANAGGGRSGAVGAAIAFDGRGSSDPDGAIAGWAWSFGDGATGTGAQPTHAYASAGTFLVHLTVTDGAGGTASDVSLVTVTAPAGASNQPPVARTGGSRSGLAGAAVTFSGAGSTDADGTLRSYAWDFGDGATASTSTAAHAYATPGVYLARLTVTDDDGAAGTDLAIVTIAAIPNAPPVARAGGSRTALVGEALSFDASASADSDGSLVAYGWDFGDGASASGSSVTHAWTSAGSHLVRLQVTDDRGASGTDLAVVTVSTPANQLPVAKAGGHRSANTGATIAFDASASTDPDGTIVAWAWDFGDGVTAATATASHAYATPGVYLVRLSVLDDRGALGEDFLLATVSVPGTAGNVAPVADAGGSHSAQPGQAVAFDGSGSTDADGAVVAWSWDFGDGGTATGVSATHAYAAPGAYLVRLTVTDDKGAKAQDVALVNVPASAPVVNVDSKGGCSSTGGGDFASMLVALAGLGALRRGRRR